MESYHLGHQGNKLCGRYVRKPNQPCVVSFMQVYQLPKVRIDRDQHPAIRFCERQ